MSLLHTLFPDVADFHYFSPSLWKAPFRDQRLLVQGTAGEIKTLPHDDTSHAESRGQNMEKSLSFLLGLPLASHLASLLPVLSPASPHPTCENDTSELPTSKRACYSLVSFLFNFVFLFHSQCPCLSLDLHTLPLRCLCSCLPVSGLIPSTAWPPDFSF